VAPAAGNLRFWTGLLFLSRASVGSVCLRPKPGSLELHAVRTDPCIAWDHNVRFSLTMSDPQKKEVQQL
jgi:hypothetical protein